MAELHIKESRPTTMVFPPGDTLQEVLELRGMTQADLAARMGRPKTKLNEIINGKKEITPQTALELERVLGVEAAFWSNLERNYRAFLEREREREALQNSIEWAAQFPYPEMVKRGWAPQAAGVDRVRALLNFFGVASPVQFAATAPAVAYRKSGKLQANLSRDAKIRAWLRRGEVLGERKECPPYDAQQLKAALGLLRSLTRKPFPEVQEQVVSTCAKAGVVLCFLPEFKGMGVNGATRWIRSGERPLVMLTLRHRYADILWFTIFHELAHILLHKRQCLFLEGIGVKSEEEEQADLFAANHLIPPSDLPKLRELNCTRATVRAVAERLGVDAGIVVGRLHHDGLLPRTHLNDLRQRLAWADGP